MVGKWCMSLDSDFLLLVSWPHSSEYLHVVFWLSQQCSHCSCSQAALCWAGLLLTALSPSRHLHPENQEALHRQPGEEEPGLHQHRAAGCAEDHGGQH